MPVVLEQEKVVKLPIFCHEVIDDLPMSLEAFRMYAHLARKWGNTTISRLEAEAKRLQIKRSTLMRREIISFLDSIEKTPTA